MNQWEEFLETIFETTVVPTIYDTDSEIQPEGRCISEELEKIGRKKTTRSRKNSFPKTITLVRR